jgi:hypothetical protein
VKENLRSASKNAEDTAKIFASLRKTVLETNSEYAATQQHVVDKTTGLVAGIQNAGTEIGKFQDFVDLVSNNMVRKTMRYHTSYVLTFCQFQFSTALVTMQQRQTALDEVILLANTLQTLLTFNSNQVGILF